MELRPLETDSAGHLSTVAAIWNAACGPDLAISERAVRYNTLPPAGVTQQGRMAVENGQPIGFVLASANAVGDAYAPPPELGWVDAIAVHPGAQRCGIGAALLAWAERWLAEQGCTRFRLGGSLRPFVPGLPTALDTERFFHNQGYVDRPAGKHVWDVARSLRGYASPYSVRQGLPGEVRPAHPGEEGAILAFFWREFPGRWRFDFQEFLAGGGRIPDYLLLLTERGVDGFCQLTFEDSLRPLDRFFMHGLPRPWGQLGPIGVSQGCRGGGYGAAVLDAGLRRLRDAGVDGCVIDWTSLLDFYGKFGFQPYRQYEMLLKEV